MRRHVVIRVAMCVALLGTVGCSAETLDEFFAAAGSPSTQAKRTESSTDSNEPTGDPVAEESDETAWPSVSQRKGERSENRITRQQASKPPAPTTTISPEAGHSSARR